MSSASVSILRRMNSTKAKDRYYNRRVMTNSSRYGDKSSNAMCTFDEEESEENQIDE
jgi:hypothetical protein